MEGKRNAADRALGFTARRANRGDEGMSFFNNVMDIRKVKILGYALSGCFLCIHIGLFLFFRYFGVTPMVYFNVFSILFYLFSVVMLRLEYFWHYVVSIFLEVAIHMSLAVIFVGTGSGFQVTLIGINTLGFYAEYLSDKLNSRHISGVALSTMGMVVYIGSYIYSWFFPAAYELPQSTCFWLQITWGVVVFLVNPFFLKIFISLALYSERTLSDAQVQANNMITALASDYSSVYYANLDTDTGICYREDPEDNGVTPEGQEFPFYEHFSQYGQSVVAESYREGFMNFIDPKNIRESLMERPIIAYRYLIQRGDREYYEMLRMAGVRRVEERSDHQVHSIGLGTTLIDEEMRETMARNEALAEALVLAEEASKAKTSFLSSMSHEIRTPMNAIIGLDTLALRDDSLTPQTREYLEKIGESAKHLLALINDILDMSRIESGRMILRKEEFSLRSMLEQINIMVMSQCNDKGIHYECRILNAVDDYYIGDDMKLKEVLINILSNAIKFTNSLGSVTLSVEKKACFEERSTLCFRIKDTGIGMDKEFIPKIFDAFSQEDGSRKNKYGSTGLGMAITRNLVEMMNGTIEVESEKGVGTEFIVTLTLRNSDHQAEEGEMRLDPALMHVLVADEDQVASSHARTILEEIGVRVDTCGSREEISPRLKEALERHSPYCLVLLDKSLWEKAGEELVKGIRSQAGAETTAVILTAYSLEELQEGAECYQADSYLAKPLFASHVLEEFGRVARRNNMALVQEKPLAKLEGRRVLLAEDIEINAEIMKEILSLSGLEADHAENGRIVVEMFERSQVGDYAAILMDVRMPEMDGLEAAKAIRSLKREDAGRIPIIALTANAFDEDVQRSLQAGMNAHLSKPVDPQQLLKSLGELIYQAERSGS